ncbi:MAG: FadR family transcriptional regulator [Spirochaetia bacterium]|jgi:GntR family transcriptional repressor for pyruvate dehydrogenase complex|nr:FadR family transcriptional regulator [Spirochaetia bacterium]
MIINHSNIIDQILDYFKQQITSGIWKVGEKIPSETVLATSLNVSRTSIRQVVSQLVGIGVLKPEQGKGTFLVGTDLDNANVFTAQDFTNLDQVLEFRQIIEPEACFLSVLHGDKNFISRLEENYDMMRNKKNDKSKFIKLDLRFHQIICQASANPFIEKTTNQIFGPMQNGQEITRTIFGCDDALFHHLKILEAIKKHDAEGAKQALFEHLQSARERIAKK